MDTGRRSFLAAALAWLASLVALVWPRRALSSPPRARGPFTRPSRPAEPAGVSWSDHPYRAPGKVYDDMAQMLDEMHAHLSSTGHAVICCDDPVLRLVGFSTFNDVPGEPEAGRQWYCSFAGIRKISEQLAAGVVPSSFGTRDGEDAVAVFRQCFSSAEGRVRLAAAYQAGGRARFKAGLGPLPR